MLGPMDFGTVYVLGAGASHEQGIALSEHILSAGLALARDLERHLEARDAPESGASALDQFGLEDLARFRLIYRFIGDYFHGGALEADRLPTIDEVFGLVDLGTRMGAHLGPAALPDAATLRRALLYLVFAVLNGCHVARLDGGIVVSYRARPGDAYERLARLLGPRDAVITLNYDLGLDLAVARAGWAIDYGSDCADVYPRGGEAPPADRERRRLYKLHGSLNWLYCPTCDRLTNFAYWNIAHIPYRDRAEPGGADDEEAWSCPVDGTPRQGLIVPPGLSFPRDNRHLVNVWQAAASALEEANEVVCIGYSLPGADLPVKFLLKQALHRNGLRRGAPARLTAVDIKAEKLVAYQWLFGVGVRTWQMSFGAYLDVRGATGRSEPGTRRPGGTRPDPASPGPWLPVGEKGDVSMIEGPVPRGALAALER
jgi:hypothetical protein